MRSPSSRYIRNSNASGCLVAPEAPHAVASALTVPLRTALFVTQALPPSTLTDRASLLELRAALLTRATPDLQLPDNRDVSAGRLVRERRYGGLLTCRVRGCYRRIHAHRHLTHDGRDDVVFTTGGTVPCRTLLVNLRGVTPVFEPLEAVLLVGNLRQRIPPG